MHLPAEVEVLICGGIGGGARNALEQVGIRLLPGVSGNADTAVERYLSGTLTYDPDAECRRHDREETGSRRDGSSGCH